MAAPLYAYNTAWGKLFDNSHAVGDTYKVELLNNSATFVATHATKAAVDNSGAYEVTAAEWPAGGITLSGVTKGTVTTNDIAFDANDVDVEAATNAIGPAYKALVYNSTDDVPVAFLDFQAAKTADVGTHFKITWAASGILKGYYLLSGETGYTEYLAFLATQ